MQMSRNVNEFIAIETNSSERKGEGAEVFQATNPNCLVGQILLSTVVPSSPWWARNEHGCGHPLRKDLKGFVRRHQAPLELAVLGHLPSQARYFGTPEICPRGCQNKNNIVGTGPAHLT